MNHFFPSIYLYFDLQKLSQGEFRSQKWCEVILQIKVTQPHVYIYIAISSMHKICFLTRKSISGEKKSFFPAKIGKKRVNIREYFSLLQIKVRQPPHQHMLLVQSISNKIIYKFLLIYAGGEIPIGELKFYFVKSYYPFLKTLVVKFTVIFDGLIQFWSVLFYKVSHRSNLLIGVWFNENSHRCPHPFCICCDSVQGTLQYSISQYLQICILTQSQSLLICFSS